MAELILTEKEKSDPSYLDWDDAALGKLVKKAAIMLKDKYGQEASFCTTGALMIIGSMLRINATDTTITVEGFSISGVDAGDYKIVVERIREPKNKEKLKVVLKKEESI